MRAMLVAASLLATLSNPAWAAQVYKWVDAQGTTHFGAQPPQGQTAESINTLTAPAPAAPPAAPRAAEEDPQAAIDEKVRREVAEQASRRKDYCETMRTNLAQLQNNPRVRVKEGDEMRRIGEEERQARIAEARKLIAEECDVSPR